MNEFSRTGKQPEVLDVSGRRPGRAPAISRKINKPSRRRSARKAANIPKNIYDIPDDDDGETPCSASIIGRSKSREPSLDEYTVGEAATMEEAVTVGEINTVGEANTAEEASTAEEIDTVGETDTIREADAVGEADFRVDMEHTAIWANEMADMENTVVWDTDAGMGMEGWDVGGLETGDPTLAWDSSTTLEMASQPPQHNNTKHYETQQGELSRTWAWYALMEALAQQRRLYFSLW